MDKKFIKGDSKITNFRMYKVKKHWIFAAATLFTILGSSIVSESNVKADTAKIDNQDSTTIKNQQSTDLTTVKSVTLSDNKITTNNEENTAKVDSSAAKTDVKSAAPVASSDSAKPADTATKTEKSVAAVNNETKVAVTSQAPKTTDAKSTTTPSVKSTVSGSSDKPTVTKDSAVVQTSKATENTPNSEVAKSSEATKPSEVATSQSSAAPIVKDNATAVAVNNPDKPTMQAPQIMMLAAANQAATQTLVYDPSIWGTINNQSFYAITGWKNNGPMPVKNGSLTVLMPNDQENDAQGNKLVGLVITPSTFENMLNWDNTGAQTAPDIYLAISDKNGGKLHSYSDGDGSWSNLTKSWVSNSASNNLLPNIKQLDLTNFDSSNVIGDAAYMLGNLNEITTLGDLSGWNVSNVKSMAGMFANDAKLNDGMASIANWNTSNVTGMQDMFSGDKALTFGDFSKWDMSQVGNIQTQNPEGQSTSNVQRMFKNTVSLHTVKIPSSLSVNVGYGGVQGKNDEFDTFINEPSVTGRQNSPILVISDSKANEKLNEEAKKNNQDPVSFSLNDYLKNDGHDEFAGRKAFVNLGGLNNGAGQSINSSNLMTTDEVNAQIAKEKPVVDQILANPLGKFYGLVSAVNDSKILDALNYPTSNQYGSAVQALDVLYQIVEKDYSAYDKQATVSGGIPATLTVVDFALPSGTTLKNASDFLGLTLNAKYGQVNHVNVIDNDNNGSIVETIEVASSEDQFEMDPTVQASIRKVQLPDNLMPDGYVHTPQSSTGFDSKYAIVYQGLDDSSNLGWYVIHYKILIVANDNYQMKEPVTGMQPKTVLHVVDNPITAGSIIPGTRSIKFAKSYNKDSVEKTFTRTIVINEPNKKPETIVQTAKFYTEYVLDVINQNIVRTLNGWHAENGGTTGIQIKIVPIPMIPGYSAYDGAVRNYGVIQPIGVTPNTKDIFHNITYKANPGTQTIKFVDEQNNPVGDSVSYKGVTDEVVDTNRSDIPSGWLLVNNDFPASVKIAPTDNPITIVLKHGSISISSDHPYNEGDIIPGTTNKFQSGVSVNDLNKNVIRTITVKDPHKGDNVITQTVSFKRDATVDTVTGTVNKYGDWILSSTASTWPAYSTPIVDGYTASQNSVIEVTPTANTSDSNITITYKANPGTQTINFVDEQNNPIGAPIVYKGVTDEVVKTNNNDIPSGWIQVNNDFPASVTITPVDTPKVVVLKHGSITVSPDKPFHEGDMIPNTTNKFQTGVSKEDLNKTVTRTITVKAPHTGDKVTTQSVSFKRDAMVDMVTGQVLKYGPWSVSSTDSTWPVFNTPIIAGYTASQANVSEVTPTADTSDSNIIITYIANPAQQTINFVDTQGNQIGDPEVLKGVTDQVVKTTKISDIPALSGWVLVNNDYPEEYKLEATDTPKNIVLKHGIYTVTSDNPHNQGEMIPGTTNKFGTGVSERNLNRTVTRIITVIDPHTGDKVTAQTVSFKRNASVDMVTGQVLNYDNWNVSSAESIWPMFTTPMVPGYTAIQASVAEVTPTADTKDSDVTITYTGNEGKQTINFVDGSGKVISSKAFTGTTDSTVKVDAMVPDGWTLSKGQMIPSEVTIKSSDTPINVVVEHGSYKVTSDNSFNYGDLIPGTHNKFQNGVTNNDLNKSVTRTIIINNPRTGKQTITQTVMFSRSAIVDTVTGAVTSYGDWMLSPNGQLIWSGMEAPKVMGYVANIPSVAKVMPTADTKNQTVSIDYTDMKVIKPIEIKNGAPIPTANFGIDNFTELPFGTKVAWNNPLDIDTTKAGMTSYKATVTYPDGSQDVISIPIVVDKKVVINNHPTVKPIVVKPGQPANAIDGINNWNDLPQGSIIKWNQIPDTKRTGTVEYSAMITYLDGMTENVMIPVTVEATKVMNNESSVKTSEPTAMSSSLRVPSQVANNMEVGNNQVSGKKQDNSSAPAAKRLPQTGDNSKEAQSAITIGVMGALSTLGLLGYKAKHRKEK